tara:strand:+ start:357 stop:743 length:387 start_codon:yes stop_codon:yes gene_type:complete
LSKIEISTKKAPAAIGTYSQAIKVDNIIYISGQIPLDPESMEVIDGDFESRAHRVFQNLQAITEACHGNLDQIVKLTIYLTNLDNFALVNSVMSEYFSKPYPARAALGVSSLPKGVDIEAEAILSLKN